MANSADPDQLASPEANLWIYTVCKGRVYLGSAGQGLNTTSHNKQHSKPLGLYRRVRSSLVPIGWQKVMFTREYNSRCLFRKIKLFHSSKFSFQKRFSSSDHFNFINTNIDICFDNILAKTRRKKGHHKAILRLLGCLLIPEKYH